MYTNKDKAGALKRALRAVSGRPQEITDLDRAILEAMIVELGGDRRTPGIEKSFAERLREKTDEAGEKRQVLDPEFVGDALDEEPHYPIG